MTAVLTNASGSKPWCARTLLPRSSACLISISPGGGASAALDAKPTTMTNRSRTCFIQNSPWSTTLQSLKSYPDMHQRSNANWGGLGYCIQAQIRLLLPYFNRTISNSPERGWTHTQNKSTIRFPQFLPRHEHAQSSPLLSENYHSGRGRHRRGQCATRHGGR